MRKLHVCAMLLVTLTRPAYAALPEPVPSGVAIGDGLDSVRQVCTKVYPSTALTELQATRAEEFSAALLDSGFLMMLNLSGARHSLFSDPADRDVRFLVLKVDGKTMVTFGFAKDRLEAVLVDAVVNVDTSAGGAGNAFAPERLAPIRSFQKKIKSRCALREVEDSRNNVYDSRGNCGQTRTYVRYEPGSDTFLVLFFE